MDPQNETRMRLVNPWRNSHIVGRYSRIQNYSDRSKLSKGCVFRAISILRYTLGELRSPKHSIDPGSTHLSLGERAEGLHFREAVTSRGRYLAPSYMRCFSSYHYLWDSRSLLWAPEKCSAVSCKSISSVHSSNPPCPSLTYKLIEPTGIDEPCACSFLRLPEYSINPVPVHVHRPCHKHATLYFREAVVVSDSRTPSRL